MADISKIILPNNQVYDIKDARLRAHLADFEESSDNTPYLYRPSGGAVKEMGDYECLDKIIGGTVAWNQLLNGTFTSFQNSYGTVTVDANGIATYTVAQLGNNVYFNTIKGGFYGIAGHKYLVHHDLYVPHDCNASKSYMAGAKTVSVTTGWNSLSDIVEIPTTGDKNNLFGPANLSTNGWEVGDTYKVKNACIYDLTQMFGPTIADYIYSLETATPGAGVAWFRKLFPKDYYDYNAGELISVTGLQSHDMTEFNQWDEQWELGRFNTSTGANVSSSDQIRSKNRIPVLPNTAHYFKTKKSGTNSGAWIMFFDASGDIITSGLPVGDSTNGYCVLARDRVITTPVNCYAVKFYMEASYGTTYNHDICINLSDPEKNNTYEPYVKHSYSLDSTLTLRGIPKLNSNNELDFDGDTYEPDGTVTRKYGVVDLGTLNWSYIDVTGHARFRAYPAGIKEFNSLDMSNILCTAYKTAVYNDVYNNTVDKAIGATLNVIAIYDTAYTDATAFKTAMSGVYLVYELATPTIETAAPYNASQMVDKYGTEQFVTNSIIPVIGHETRYLAKLKYLPTLNDNGNGSYLIEQKKDQMYLSPFQTEDLIYDAISTQKSSLLVLENCGENYPLNDVKVFFELQQDLNGYDYPWAPGRGKNLFNKETAVSGFIAASGTSIQTPDYENLTSDFIPVIEGENYTYTHWPSGQGEYWTGYAFYSEQNLTALIGERQTNSALSFTFTVPTGANYVRIGSRYLVNGKAQLEKGSVATEWEPCANICPINGYNSVKITRTRKNLLPSNLDAYQAIGNYLVLPNIIPENTLAHFTFEDNDTNIDISGCSIGFTYDLTNGSLGYQWAINAGVISQYRTNIARFGTAINSLCRNVFVYPKTTETLQKLFARYKIMIEFDSTDTPYEPYVGQTTNIQFPAKVGTVCSGVLNITDGTLTVDKAMVDLGTLDWVKPISNTFYSLSIRKLAHFPANNSSVANIISTNYKTVDYTSIQTNNINGIALRVDDTTVRVKDMTIDDVAVFKAAMSGVQLVYELATPIVYNLTPKEITTVLGTNYIWSDVGKISATYAQDTKLLTNVFNNIIINQSHIKPLKSYTYTNIIGTTNENRYASFFFAKIKWNDFHNIWRVKFKITVFVPNQINYYASTITEFWGTANTYLSYKNQNAIKNTSYRPVYYVSYFAPSELGFQNNCGGWYGINLINSATPTNTNYKRTCIVELLDYENCTVEFADNVITPDNIPNRAEHTNWYASTNTSFNNLDFSSQGLAQTGDANTTIINRLNNAYAYYITNSDLYRYQLLFTISENLITPLNNNNNVVGATKTLLTNVEFNPFGRIYYYATTSTYTANSLVASTAPCFMYDLADLRYTFNLTSEAATEVAQNLTAYKNVYLKVIPQDNGMVTLASATPLVQELPQAPDGGYWYILLGRTYDWYRMVLLAEHPVYEYYNGTIHEIKPHIHALSYAGDGSEITDLDASNISSGTLSGDRLATSGATAGTYGDSTAQTPDYGSTFKVPTLTVDNKGRVTAVSQHTVKMPESIAKDEIITIDSTSNNVPTSQAVATLIAEQIGTSFVESVTGTAVTITGEPNTRYNCGELTSLTITPPNAGTIDIIFTSGTTPTILTAQNVKWPWWFQPTSLSTSTIYELLITDGTLGSVMSWEI